MVLLIFMFAVDSFLPYLIQAQSIVRVEKVRFMGLKKTRTSVVMRELAFRPQEEPLAASDTASVFQRTKNNILNTRLFHSCRYFADSVKEVSPGETSIQLVFDLQERWYTIPIPSVELADRNFNEWWYDRKHDFRRVNAGITILKKNMRGRNEDLQFGAGTGFTKRLEFIYTIPYIDKRQVIGMKIQALYLGNKEVAVRSLNNRLDYHKDEASFGRNRFQAGIQLTARRNIYRYHSLDLVYHYNRISAFVQELNPAYFLGSSFQRYGELRYSFIFDHRNYRPYATSGWFARIKASRFGLLPSDNFRLWTAQATFSVYQPIRGRFFWASRFDAELAEDKALPYLGSRTLGYENRFVRGYERNVVEGMASYHVRNSLRWKILSRVWQANGYLSPEFSHLPLNLFLCPFVDFGGIRNPRIVPENKALANTMLLGYGMGLHVLTVYDLVLRMEYTRNRHGGAGLYFSLLSDI